MRRLAPLLCLLACGKGTVSAKDFPKAFAEAVCQVQQICRAGSVALEAQCEADSLSLYEPDLGKAIAAGKSVFNADQAQACVDGLRARGCERTPPEVDQACEKAVTGTVATGGSCSWIYECAQGRCDPSAPGVCPAKCAPVAQEGQSCGDTPCDLRAGLRCIDNVCSKPKGPDQKCGSTTDCQIGFYCDGFSQCSARAGEQAVCTADEQCLTGLFCDAGNEGGLCRKRFAQGQTCTAASDQAITFACADGLLCKGFSFGKPSATPGTCTPLGQVGAACAAAAEVTGCAKGLTCKGGTCQELPTSGPCTSDDDCRPGVAYCDANSQCQLLVANGGACQGSNQCASHFCDPSSSKCVEAEAACHEP